MEDIKKIIHENFSRFDATDVSDQYDINNIIELHSSLQENSKKILLIEKNKNNSLYLEMLSGTPHNFYILNRDNYICLDDINDIKSFIIKLTNFLLNDKYRKCCICKDMSLRCVLCRICSAATCHVCMEKSVSLSDNIEIICALCRNKNA